MVRSTTEGTFLVLEGIDGSGTTTQVARLAAALEARGIPAKVTHEPSDADVGRWIRARLRDRRAGAQEAAELALAFACDRLHHVRTEIAPALAQGQIVLSDRYVMSSWAYQSLDCPEAWVRAINRFAPWPDLTFYLKIDPHVAVNRVQLRQLQDGSGAERFDHLALQHDIAAAYDRYAEEGHPNVHIIDAGADIATIGDVLLRRTLQAIQEK